MVNLKSKSPFHTNIARRIENSIPAMKLLNIRPSTYLLIAASAVSGTRQGTAIGIRSSTGLSGNIRSAAGEARPVCDPLVKITKGWWIFHRPIRSEGRNLMIHGEDFRIYDVSKIRSGAKFVVPSESPKQIVYPPERGTMDGAEENRSRNDGRRCFHKVSILHREVHLRTTPNE